MYSKEHADIKSKNEPVNAAVDKLYYYKTINYTKKARVITTYFFNIVLEEERSPVS